MNLQKLTIANGTGAGSSYVWTVPKNLAWHVLVGHVQLTTNATVGNRSLHYQVADEDGVIYSEGKAGAVQAASLVRDYDFKAGIYRETSSIGGLLEVPLAAELIMPQDWTLTIEDEDSVDASGDSLVVGFCVHQANLSGMRI